MYRFVMFISGLTGGLAVTLAGGAAHANLLSESNCELNRFFKYPCLTVLTQDRWGSVGPERLEGAQPGDRLEFRLAPGSRLPAGFRIDGSGVIVGRSDQPVAARKIKVLGKRNGFEEIGAFEFTFAVAAREYLYERNGRTVSSREPLAEFIPLGELGKRPFEIEAWPSGVRASIDSSGKIEVDIASIPEGVDPVIRMVALNSSQPNLVVGHATIAFKVSWETGIRFSDFDPRDGVILNSSGTHYYSWEQGWRNYLRRYPFDPQPDFRQILGNIYWTDTVYAPSHDCALTWDGRVICGGTNRTGDVGTGNFMQVPTSSLPYRGRRPVVGFNGLGQLPQAIAITGGQDFVCALLASDRKVACWGNNEVGQLGIGKRSAPIPKPSLVVGLERVKAVAAGSQHACALSEDGRVRCWGAAQSFQLGSRNVSETYPVSVCRDWEQRTDPSDPTSVQQDCMGYRRVGYRMSSSPIEVQLPLQATSIAVSGASSCALLADGSVSCWGANVLGAPIRQESERFDMDLCYFSSPSRVLQRRDRLPMTGVAQISLIPGYGRPVLQLITANGLFHRAGGGSGAGGCGRAMVGEAVPISITAPER